jgi:hypothetical protein
MTGDLLRLSVAAAGSMPSNSDPTVRAGWAAIHRSHQLAIFGLFLFVVGVFLAISA